MKITDVKAGEEVLSLDEEVAVHNYFGEYIIDNALSGDNIDTFVCSLSSLSPERIGQFNFKANAKYGESLKLSSIASSSLSKNLDAGIILISPLMNDKTKKNSVLDNLDCDNNLSIFLSNSEKIYSGVISLNTLNTLFASKTSNALPLLTSAEKTTLKSTTSSIGYLPFSNFLYLFANDKLTSSDNSFACSSVNLDLDKILLSLAKSSSSCFSLFSTNNCQLISEADFNPINSSGIGTVIVAILSPKRCSDTDYLKVLEYLKD